MVLVCGYPMVEQVTKCYQSKAIQKLIFSKRDSWLNTYKRQIVQFFLSFYVIFFLFPVC